MILGALVDAGIPLATLSHGLKSVRAGRYALRSRRVMRAGLRATKVDVVIKSGWRSPLSLSRIQRVISASGLPAWVKERGHEVFDRLANSEGVAHGVKASLVEFHEVGSVDSLVDVLGGLLGCYLLRAERVSASPVNLGSGFIETAHGTLPVPGPAVAGLAHDVPVYSAGPSRELTTPTGLALLLALKPEITALPLMRINQCGYGAGEANPQDWPNALRIFVGVSGPAMTGTQETIVQLETNVDDLNPQLYESIIERLFAAGALDVTLAPVIMKQGRPGIVLTVLVTREKAEAAVQVLARETTTLGIRVQDVSRWVLKRRRAVVRTASGPVHVKIAEIAPGFEKVSPEYRDCKRAADRSGRSVREIMEEAMAASVSQRRTASGKTPRGFRTVRESSI